MTHARVGCLPGKMKRAQRLLKIIDLLRSDPTYTAARLAEECSVSERTLYRDIAALSCDLGVPIYYQDGYKIGPHGHAPYPGLTVGELLAVYVAASSPALSPQFPHGSHLRSALEKIGEVLGAQAALSADRMARSVSIDAPAHPDVERDGERLAALETCIRRAEVVSFRYSSLSSGQTSVHTVDPYALTFRRRSWYLVGHSHRHRQFRTFKVRRMEGIEPTGDRFTRDGGFDLDEYFARSWEMFHGDPVRVVARFAPRVAQMVTESRYHPTQVVRAEPDGSVLFSAEVAGIEEIGRWLLRFGGDVEVLDPDELRETLLREGARIAATYGGAADVLELLGVDQRRVLASDRPVSDPTPRSTD
jgi:predicted DNA-binding transcriptional regulator YafY